MNMLNDKEKNGRQILVFTLLDEEMGLDITTVREVLKPLEIRPLMHAPEFVEGVIYVRNCVLAVVSLRKRFNIKSLESGSRSRVVICKVNNMILGVIVDSVSEVLVICPEDIQPVPQILALQERGSYASGMVKVGDRMITLLDLEKVLTPEELSSLR